VSVWEGGSFALGGGKDVVDFIRRASGQARSRALSVKHSNEELTALIQFSGGDLSEEDKT